MTYNNIYEYFKDDQDLLKFFDPLSVAENNEQAALEIYHKLIEYSRDYHCKFVRLDHGYIFYTKPRRWFQRRMLVSFCLKPEHRNRTSTELFWKEIVKHMGKRFMCYLYSKNTRAINFLLKGGMKVEKTNDLITLLSI